MFVKICGITNEADALLCVAMGADAIGFIFAPSPRQVTAAAVTDIVKRLPADTTTIGVFRDHSADDIVSTVSRCGLSGAQLSGHEPPSLSRKVTERVSLVIKAFSAGDPMIPSAAEWGADVVMLDGASPGSGQVFDWTLAEVPASTRMLLAGGLSPDNVERAIATVRPWGVDVNSGVEGPRKGEKDPVKVRAFIQRARAAASAAGLNHRTSADRRAGAAERAESSANYDPADEVFDWEYDT
jgi:phosphoribosylanthranilate isomerase